MVAFMPEQSPPLVRIASLLIGDLIKLVEFR
jgi:hypothetical protein